MGSLVFVVISLVSAVIVSGVIKNRVIKSRHDHSSNSPSKVVGMVSSVEYHGAFAWCVTVLFFLIVYLLSSQFFASDFSIFKSLMIGFLTGLASVYAAKKLPYPSNLNTRYIVEGGVNGVLFAMATLAVVTTIAIVLSLLFESYRFFSVVSLYEFFFTLEWNPGTAIREGQVAGEGAFGVWPLVTGTALITLIAMLIAGPIGLFSAIYTAEFASAERRKYIKPALEMLAGIPTVVFGFFAAVTVGPLISELGRYFGFDIALESALSAGLVMGIMIIPYVSSMSDDAINAVPQSLRNGSYALGSTKYETITKVVLPAALPGIAGGMLLGVSRAIGETMIVVMAAGLAANLTVNPFEAVTTFTVQIATSLVGDHEFDSARTLSAFALGLFLFCITFVLNLLAIQLVRRYRNEYK